MALAIWLAVIAIVLLIATLDVLDALKLRKKK